MPFFNSMPWAFENWTGSLEFKRLNKIDVVFLAIASFSCASQEYWQASNPNPIMRSVSAGTFTIPVLSDSQPY
jgi:hypothetical protein